MIIRANIHTKASESKIISKTDGTYEIFVKSFPEKGKANLEIIGLLSKYFEVHYSKVSIKNPHSRKKIIVIEKS